MGQRILTSWRHNVKEKLKRGFGAAWKWIKRHKALVIVLIIVCAVGGCVLRIRQAGQEMEAALSQMALQTDEAAYRDLTSTINATGYVQSDNTRSLTTTLVNTEVTEVNVEVGDVVQAGDALCSFDTEEIEESLADARESLDVAQAQSNLSVQGAERSLSDAVNAQNYQVGTAGKNRDYSWTTYEEAVADYNEAVADLESKTKEENDKKNEMDDAESRMNRAQDEMEESAGRYAEAQAAAGGDIGDLLEDIQNGTGSLSGSNLNQAANELSEAYSDYTAKQAAAQAAATEYSTISAEYQQIKAEREALENSVDSMKTAMDSSYHTYEQQEDAYNNTVITQNSSVAGMQDSLTNSRLSASVSTQTQENQVKTYERQLEKGVLTSPISGTVTEVNVQEGDTYTGGVIVTVQDCNAFIIEAEIDEYDISDIKEGMKVIFRTDATRDEELEGEVIFVSPVPTGTSSSNGSLTAGAASGGHVTYQIKVAINTDTDRLRLGMTAKMNIVLSEVEHVLTVPYDAVQTDENGNDVVYVMESVTGEDGQVTQQQRAVPVTVGTEGDYYVEIISDEITEGMTVVVPQEDAVNIMDLMMGQ